jgi:hypothetical protein
VFSSKRCIDPHRRARAKTAIAAGKLRGELFQQEVASHPALALKLPVDHILNQSPEVIVAEVRAGPSQPAGYVIANTSSSSLRQVGFQRIYLDVLLRFQQWRSRGDESTQPHIRGHLVFLSGNCLLRYDVTSTTL